MFKPYSSSRLWLGIWLFGVVVLLQLLAPTFLKSFYSSSANASAGVEANPAVSIAPNSEQVKIFVFHTDKSGLEDRKVTEKAVNELLNKSGRQVARVSQSANGDRLTVLTIFYVDRGP